MMDDYTRSRLNEADRLDGLGFPENAAAVRVGAVELLSQELERARGRVLELEGGPRRLAEVHAVDRETGDGDGLYLFENAEQADAYAMLTGAEVVSVPVNDAGSALELIEGEEKALEDEAADEGGR